MTPPVEPSFAKYEVEVLDAAGSRVFEVSGLELSEDYNLRFGANLERMPAGDYEAHLYGLDGDRREHLQKRSVSVLKE